MHVLSIPVLVIALLSVLVPAFAQSLSLSGTVRDTDGVVPGANISLRGSSGDPRQTTTDSSGHYDFTGLNAGRYELTFERKGFATFTQAVLLSGNDSRPVDATLTPQAAATFSQPPSASRLSKRRSLP